MKMRPPELAKLKAALAPLDTMALRDQYRRRDISHAHMVIDIDRRYRWDLWWLTPWSLRDEIIQSLGGAWKDSHIDTALRKLVAPL